MLSRIAAANSLKQGLTRVLETQKQQYGLQNALFKRDSGHNTIMVKPSPWDFRFTRNWIHFYALIFGIPLAVITSIINIRADPELIEIPEGYKPRHWEYQKHPIQRFFAKYVFYPMELEHETSLSFQEYKAEHRILLHLAKKIDTTMKFYNDHRSRNFSPNLGADYIRSGRDEWAHGVPFNISLGGDTYDDAYDPNNEIVPVEGYIDGPQV